MNNIAKNTVKSTFWAGKTSSRSPVIIIRDVAIFNGLTILIFLPLLVVTVKSVYSEELITDTVQVNGESMLPTFNDKSLVFTCDAQHCPFTDLKEGDIISFHSEKHEGADILHRIYEVNHSDNGNVKSVETVGDNPERRFYEEVDSDMYIGKAINQDVWAGEGVDY